MKKVVQVHDDLFDFIDEALPEYEEARAKPEFVCSSECSAGSPLPGAAST